MVWAVLSFLATQALLVGAGLAATLRHRSDAQDYLVAGRSIHPWLVALAASSTNSSGFMFIGLIGETYHSGLSSMWLMIGWIAGDYLAWHFIQAIGDAFAARSLQHAILEGHKLGREL